MQPLCADTLLPDARRLLPELRSLKDDLHRHPELSFQEMCIRDSCTPHTPVFALFQNMGIAETMRLSFRLLRPLLISIFLHLLYITLSSNFIYLALFTFSTSFSTGSFR